MKRILAVVLSINFFSAFGKELTWETPTHSGLFSQFMQLKMMYAIAKRFERNLNVVESISIHLGDQILNMCEVFELPDDISCQSKELNDKLMNQLGINYVQQNLTTSVLKSEQVNVFYSDRVPLKGAKDTHDAVVRATNIPLHLNFHTKYSLLVSKFKSALGIDGVLPFTVVHWRRGDQLESRCFHHKDRSVNCETADKLIDIVRNYTKDKIVYVATNEDPESIEIVHLRNAGFKTFADGMGGKNVSSLEAIVIDSSLMIDATTFLAWGVSEVDDVVEYERMSLNKTFCVTDRLEDDQDDTWCSRVKAGNNPPYLTLGNIARTKPAGANHDRGGDGTDAVGDEEGEGESGDGDGARVGKGKKIDREGKEKKRKKSTKKMSKRKHNDDEDDHMDDDDKESGGGGESGSGAQ